MDQLPILRMGSEGEDVRQLQQFLISQGFDLGEMGADGDFGRRTQEAVRQFQARAGINADSVVGPKTYEAILQVAQAAMPVPRPNPERVPQPAGQGLQPGGAVAQQQTEAFDARFGRPSPSQPLPQIQPGSLGTRGQQAPMPPAQFPAAGPMPMAGGPVSVPSMAPLPQPGQAPMPPQMGTRFPGDPGMGAPANGLGPSAGRPPDASRLSPMEVPIEGIESLARGTTWGGADKTSQFPQPDPMPMAGGPVSVPSMAPMPQPPPQPLSQGGQVRQQQMENFDARFGQPPPPPRVQPTADQLSLPPPQSNTWPVAEPGEPKTVTAIEGIPPPPGADFWLRNGTSPAEMNRGMHFRSMPADQMSTTPLDQITAPPTGEPPRMVTAVDVDPNAFSGKPQLGPINMGGGPPPGFGQGQQQTSTPEEMSRVSPTLGMLMGQGLDPAMAERILGELIRMVGAQQQPGV
jgi:peptidoglycan hydrolase-like protein with peptidoglycan-binding domain